MPYRLPVFAVEAPQLLPTPRAFYDCLREGIRAARKRIVLTSLYIGAHETELVESIARKLESEGADAPDVHIVIDFLRGSRRDKSGVSSVSLLQPLCHKYPDKVKVSLFQLPGSSSIFSRLVPPRFNEAFGLLHVKSYVFDDDVIISGANLSRDYFENRQDRYALFRKSGQLSEYFSDLSNTLGEASHTVGPSGLVRSRVSKAQMTAMLRDFAQKWSQHPLNLGADGLGDRIIPDKSKLDTILSNHPSVAVPYLHVGRFGIMTEEAVVQAMVDSAVSEDASEFVLSSAYLNLGRSFERSIFSLPPNLSKQIIVASPEANGFYGSKDISRHLPAAYTYLTLGFMERARRVLNEGTFAVKEYFRKGWTYHAKGIWLLGRRTSMTIIGSSNFGLRSHKRDVEAQVLLLSRDQKLNEDIRKEATCNGGFGSKINKVDVIMSDIEEDDEPLVREKRFTFKGFRDRVKSLKINAHRKFKTTEADVPLMERDSFFVGALAQWRDLNSTADFKAFLQKVEDIAESLEQVLYHKETICKVVMSQLEQADELTYEPLLSLVSALAQDLQEELFDYFYDMLAVIVKLLAKNNAELFEWIFNTIATLYKCLAAEISKDLKAIFEIMQPVLGDHRPYIREFCAEAAAFLVRKLPQPKYNDIVLIMVSSLAEDTSEEYCEGISLVFFEVVKQVRNGLHSRALQYLDPVIESVLQSSNLSDSSHIMLVKLFHLLLHHSNKESCEPLWTLIMDKVQTNVVSPTTGTFDWTRALPCLNLLSIAANLRKGSRIRDHSSLAKFTEKCISAVRTHEFSSKDLDHPLLPIARILAAGISNSTVSDAVRYVPAVELFYKLEESSCIFAFNETAQSLNQETFARFIFPLAVRYVLAIWKSSKWECLSFLSRMLTPEFMGHFAIVPHEFKSPNGFMKLPSHSINLAEELLVMVESLPQSWDREFEVLQTGNGVMSRVAVILAACNCLESVVAPVSRAGKALSELLKSLLAAKLTDLEQSKRLKIFGAKVLRTLCSVYAKNNNTEALAEFAPFALQKFFVQFHDEPICVEATFNVIERVPNGHAVFSSEMFEVVKFHLKKNAGSLHRTCRIHTLQILMKFFTADKRCSDVLQLCTEIDEEEDSVTNLRDKVAKITRLDKALLTPLPNDCDSLVTRFLLALLCGKFAPLQPSLLATLQNLASRRLPKFWGEYEEFLQKAKKNGLEGPLSYTFTDGPQLIAPSVSKYSFSCTWSLKLSQKISESYHVFSDSVTGLRRIVSEATYYNFGKVDNEQCYRLFLQVLRPLPDVVTAKSSFIVPLFLEFLVRTTAPEEDAPNSKSWRLIVLEYLEILKPVSDPRNLYLADKLYEAELELLCNSDPKLQSSALQCLLTWKQSAVLKYSDHLMGLTDESKFRDFLSNWDMEEFSNSISNTDRPTLMRFLVNILFGKMLSRGGKSSSTRGGPKARRNAIFSFLADFYDSERRMMLDLLMKPFSHIVSIDYGMDLKDAFKFSESFLSSHETISLKSQLGFLNVLEDMIKQFRNLVAPFLPVIMKIILYLIRIAEVTLQNEPTESTTGEHMQTNRSMLRDIRQQGIRRLTQVFSIEVDFKFDPYVGAIFECFIVSRIPKFEVENTQAPSAILDLIATWASSIKYAAYLETDTGLIPKILSLLSAKNVKDTVVSLVLKSIESILLLDEEHPQSRLSERLLKPHVSILLTHMAYLLKSCKGGRNAKFLGDSTANRVVNILSRTSTHIDEKDGENTEALLDILLPSLKRPSKAVPETVKVEILKIFSRYLPSLPSLRDEELAVKSRYVIVVAQMFATLSERSSRAALLDLFGALSRKLTALSPVLKLLQDFNSYSPKRLDEPDFNRRFDAFKVLSNSMYLDLDTNQWLPVLHNLTFFLYDQTEFSIRTSASLCLQKFIDLAAGVDTNSISVSDEQKYGRIGQVIHVLLPAIKKGFHSTSEIVRQEFLTLLGLIVSKFPHVKEFTDMAVLLAEGDDEASFFSNFYHLQVHRRIRAMRRLTEECRNGHLSSSNVNNVFMPLISHIIYESERSSDHNIINEAISCVAALSGQLAWGKYHSTLRSFLKAIARRPQQERELIRVIVAIIENFNFQMDLPATDDSPDGDQEQEDDDQMNEGDGEPAIKSSDLSARIHDAVVEKLVPDLFAHLEKKDDDNVSLRVPIAIAIAKLLRKLPSESMNMQLPKLLTSISQFLRNKLQDVRDSTRDALVKIATLLGPVYFSFILRELDGALQRGYQLHVLGYSVHTLLSKAASGFPAGSIDSCVSLLVKIFVKDLFGVLEEEREAQEMKGKMIEMKTARSFDSFEILASVVSSSQITTMIMPLKELMLESSSSKLINKIETILRRVSQGLNLNSLITAEEIMVFIHGLVTENLPLSKLEEVKKPKKSTADDNFLVQMHRNDPITLAFSHFQASAHIFIEFGMFLLLSGIKKEKIKLNLEEHRQMLDPIVPLLGKALYSKFPAVCIAALKVLSLIAKTPLPSLEITMPLVTKRLFEIIKKGQGFGSELSQSCFKLLAVIIRDCSYVEVKQHQLLTIISAITPEIEDVDKQSVVFSLIQAILSRKLVINEVYDLLEVVSRIMITSQSLQVRQLCRKSYITFLLDYPHGPVRIQKQINYLLKNLNYEFESGRESVLEVLSSIVSKFGDDALFKFSEMLFLALAIVLVNDESSRCRSQAGSLIKSLFSRLDMSRVEKLSTLLHEWFRDDQRPSVQRTAAQVFGFLFESRDEILHKVTDMFLDKLSAILQAVALEVKQVERETEIEENTSELLGLWETGYYCLVSFEKLIAKSPDIHKSAKTTSAWEMVKLLLLHPHSWIRLISNRLIGRFFSFVDLESVGKAQYSSGPFYIMITNDGALLKTADSLSRQLLSEHITPESCMQILKNLTFIGRCFLALDSQKRREESFGEQDPSAVKPPLLLQLFRKLAFLARGDIGVKKNPTMRRSVFQWFGAIVGFIPQIEIRPYMESALGVLCRVVEDKATLTQENEEIKGLAKEVMELMQKHAGSALYIEVYNKVVSTVKEIRQDRQVKRKIQAVLDPEAAAKRKVQKTEAKKEGRKRKVAEQMMRKGKRVKM